MCDRDFCDVFGENPNVKQGNLCKEGGGGLDGIEREEKIGEKVGFPTVFPQNSHLLPIPYGSALRWSNFWW
jgi:hypothetical protein